MPITREERTDCRQVDAAIEDFTIPGAEALLDVMNRVQPRLIWPGGGKLPYISLPHDMSVEIMETYTETRYSSW